MRSVRMGLLLMMAVVTVARAQQHEMPKAPPPKTETQKAFDQMKTLAGSWEGQVSTEPPTPGAQGQAARVSFQVASLGHTLIHDMNIEGRPDHPFTMMVVDGDRLLLTHYCDADNRPRMAGKVSPDGKTVAFDFIDVSGNLKYGHMQRAVFTFIDANHHTEDWTYLMPGDKGVRAHFDLQRANAGASSSSGK